ncbi:hypothetical protein HYFRA_00013833 [Hymenoscyphus fraxineus]|uniref:Uncharacterized protein n=1 Tax=Hymenoscyphus fraxineus TaxID=746836 RepID=A0A9N9Q137_9HELO|nr:hypothetical protein HYFRA_00013833 [Hymenoscyphus fraxineus]
MPLLPNLPSGYVQTGSWRNHTAPSYRQYLWTTTNVTAIIVLGLLGILGTAAGNRLWPIIRHFLQPSIQLLDPDNRRTKLSRTDAIRSLQTDIKNYVEEFKTIWRDEHGFKRKINYSLAIIRGNIRQAPDLTTASASTELRFGLFAILNIASFAFLGITVPFFLAEGLQGEAVVQSYLHIPGWCLQIYDNDLLNGDLYDNDRDINACLTGNLTWSQSKYCVELRKSFPPYEAENVNMTDPLFENSPFRFLRENGDHTLQAIKLSGHTSLQDIAFNAKSGGDTLLHELTCVPVPLDRFVNDFNASSYHYELQTKALLSQNWETILQRSDFFSHSHSQYDYDSYGNVTVHYSMALKTNDSIGSGRQIHYTRNFPPKGEVVDINNPDHRTWYQSDVDSTLPFLTSAETEYHSVSHKRANAVRQAVDTNILQTFLITIKTQTRRVYGGRSDLFKIFSDDPIFGARLPKSGSQEFFPDREVSAIGCAETFKRCSSNQCTEIFTPTWSEARRTEGNDLLDNYRSKKSVWINSMLNSIYSNSNPSFLHSRRTWQQDIEERFIRALLRARYATKIATEKIFASSPLWPEDETYRLFRKLRSNEDTAFLLYHNPDHTNINIWGVVATTFGYLYIIAVSYWMALLSPIVLLVKAIVRISSKKRKGFQECMISVRHGAQVAMRFIGMCVRTPKPVTATAPERSNAVSMDNLQVRHEDEHPENPPRAAINPGIEATN